MPGWRIQDRCECFVETSVTFVGLYVQLLCVKCLALRILSEPCVVRYQGLMKSLQWFCGSALSVHGAMSLWKRDIFVNHVSTDTASSLAYLSFTFTVLVVCSRIYNAVCVVWSQVMFNHDTEFHGEDLYMGVILHRMNMNYAVMVRPNDSLVWEFARVTVKREIHARAHILTFAHSRAPSDACAFNELRCSSASPLRCTTCA